MINLKIALESDHEFRGDEEPIEYPQDLIKSAELEMEGTFNFEINPLVAAMEGQRPFSRRHRAMAVAMEDLDDHAFWSLLLVAIGIALVAVGKMLNWFSGGSKGGSGGGGGGGDGPIIRFETKLIRISPHLTENSKGFHLLLGGDASADVKERIRKEKLFDRVQERLFTDFTEYQREFVYPNGAISKSLDKSLSEAQYSFSGNRVIRDALITKLSHTWLDAFDKIDTQGWRSAGYDWEKVGAGAEEVVKQQNVLDSRPGIVLFQELRDSLLNKPLKLSDAEATKWLGQLFEEVSPKLIKYMQEVTKGFKEALEACTKLQEQVETSQKELEAGFAKHPIDIKDLSKSTASKEKNIAGISEANVEYWENKTREHYNEATRLTKQAFQITLNGMRKELSFISSVIHLFNQRIDFYNNAAAAMLELAKSVKSSFKTSGDDIPQELEDAITAFSKKA